jgi:hypothetical protein
MSSSDLDNLPSGKKLDNRFYLVTERKVKVFGRGRVGVKKDEKKT